MTPSSGNTLLHTAEALLTNVASMANDGATALDAWKTLAIVLDWAEKVGAYSPANAVNTHGYTLPEALARHKRGIPLVWLENWQKRFGLSSIFAHPGDGNVLSFWFEHRLLPDVYQKRTFRGNDAKVALWLVENASAAFWKPRLARNWLDALATVDGVDRELSESLMQSLMERGLEHADRTRPAERWTGPGPAATIGQAQDWLVWAPSGQKRTLMALWQIHGRIERDKCTALPELPHKRRDELVTHWTLSANLDDDLARARLWATLAAKPEALNVFWNLVDTAPQSERALRIKRLFDARDPKGRSLVGFLSVQAKPELFAMARAICAHDGLDWNCAVLDERGRGLAEQCVEATVLFNHNDPFFCGAPNTPPDPDCAQGWLGPSERRKIWNDLLIDCLVPQPKNSQFALSAWAAWLESFHEPGPECERLGQARALFDFQETVERAAREQSNPPLSGQAKTLARMKFQTKLNTCVQRLTAQPPLLDVGVEEWRQWRLLGRKQLASMQNNGYSAWFDVQAAQLLDEAERRIENWIHPISLARTIQPAAESRKKLRL